MGYNQQSSAGARGIGKRVIADLESMNIPATPKNYALWFDYLSDTHPDLSRAVNQLRLKMGSLTESSLNHLYERFYNVPDNRALLEQIERELFELLHDIAVNVAKTGTDAGAFQRDLDGFAQSIMSVDTQSGLQFLISRIREKAGSLIDSTRFLEDRLAQSQSTIEGLRTQLQHARREAMTDGLTALHNRKALDEFLGEAAAQYAAGKGFSAIMFDIDFFKPINDKFGHKVGDAILRMAANLLRDSIKGRDFAARYGGEEFVIVLPETSLDSAATLADDIRARVARKKFKLAQTEEAMPAVTVSAGVASFGKGDTVDSFLERLDKALYAAKQSGRNSMRTERDLTQEAPQRS